MHVLPTQGVVEPKHSGDEVGHVLADLHEDMERELDRTHAQADRALKDKQKVLIQYSLAQNF